MLYPGAEWHPVKNFGYPQGTHGQLEANGPRGAFWHLAQGWKGGAEATFNTEGRGSAHLIFNFEGPPWQFVDLSDAAWHAGGRIPTGFHELANLYFWGFEFEGGGPAGPAYNDHQLAEAVKAHHWLAAHYPIKWVYERRVDLWEHHEVYATDCPALPIPWDRAIALLKGEEAMTDADRAWVIQFSGGLKLIKGGPPTVYVVDHRGKRPFPGGPLEFLKVGFDWDNVIRLPDPVIGAIPNARL
jgi:hypothetical protein